MTSNVVSQVSLTALDASGQPKRTTALEALYRSFEQELLVALWTEVGDLVPSSPRPQAAVVIGKTVRRARGDQAERAIVGYCVANDVTFRDWQFRTREWLQGKAWEATTPLGPLVTPDELSGDVRPLLEMTTLLDGKTMQHDSTFDLWFDPVDLVEYISTIVTLRPGDVILTGTSGAVGHAQTSVRFLTPGQVVTAEVEHLGRCVNTVTAEEPA